MYRTRIIFPAILLMMLGIFGCQARETEPVSQMQEPVLEPLVSEALLAEAGLERVWQRQMPLKTGETLKQIYVVDDRVYGLSSDNYLLSLDREKGNVVFSKPIGRSGFPVFDFKHFGGELYSVVGNRLMEYDRGSGDVLSEKSFDFGVMCPAARNSEFFYIGGSDRRVHVFKAANKVESFEASAMSDSGISSIIAGDNFVVFSTEAGDVVFMEPGRPRQLCEPFKAAEAIVGPMVLRGQRLYFASGDTNIYCLNVINGTLQWQYQGGAVFDRGPVVTDSFVYQNIGDKGLIAIDRRNGNVVWQLTERAGILAEFKNKSFVMTDTGRLVVMDNETREELYSVNFTCVKNFASNTYDSKIYVADERGRIACLKPSED